MMARIVIVCVLVIQMVIFLMVKVHHVDNFTFAFWEFFGKYKIFTVYLCIINIIAFITYAVDKFNAVKNRRRIRVATLLGLAFAGGSIGSLLAMYTFHHKTRKNYFAVGVPLIILTQIVVLFYFMNVAL